MKKRLILILILVLILSILIIPRSNTKNAEAVISSDHSTITYDGEIYVPIDEKDLLLYRIGGFVLTLSYTIGFLIEFIISRFMNGIKNNPIKKERFYGVQ